MAGPCGLAASATLTIAGRDASPGGEMAGARERRDIGPDLGHDDLGGPATDAGDGVEAGDQLIERAQLLGDLGVVGRDPRVQLAPVGQVLLDQEAQGPGQPSLQRLDQQLPLRPQLGVGQPGQLLRVGHALEHGIEHPLPRGAQQLSHDRPELDVRPFQHLLQALDHARPLSHQRRPPPGQLPQLALGPSGMKLPCSRSCRSRNASRWASARSVFRPVIAFTCSGFTTSTVHRPSPSRTL